MYVTSEFRKALDYAKSALAVASDAQHLFPFGNLCVVFRLTIPSQWLLQDLDEVSIPARKINEVSTSYRIAHEVFIGNQEVSLINPMHPQSNTAEAHDIIWHVIPPWFSSNEPLSY